MTIIGTKLKKAGFGIENSERAFKRVDRHGVRGEFALISNWPGRDYRPRGRIGQRRVLVIRIITHPHRLRHRSAMHPLAGLLWRLRSSKPLPDLSRLLWWHRLDTGSTVPIIDTPWTQLAGRYFRRSLHGNQG